MPGGSSAYEISYTFEDSSFQMSVHSTAASAKLIFPVISPASERVYQTPKEELIIQKKAAQIKLTSSKALEWDKIVGKRMFNFVPGFEALAVENSLDAKGNCTLRIDINQQ